MPRLKFYGVRGSIPRPEKDFLKYGGNTTCHAIEIKPDHWVVLDLGTGFYKFAEELKKKKFKGQIDVFVSHGHLDHIYTSVFSSLHFDPNVKITIYGSKDTLNRIRQVFNPKTGGWPIGPEFVPNLKMKEIKPAETIKLKNEIKVRPFVLSHHGDALGFQLTLNNGRVISYLVDHQPAGMGEANPNKLSKEEEEKILRNSDVAIVDAHFLKESDIKWGHGSIEFWVKRYQKLPRKLRLVLTHYAPELTDSKLDKVVERLKGKYKRIPIFAKERKQIRL